MTNREAARVGLPDEVNDAIDFFEARCFPNPGIDAHADVLIEHIRNARAAARVGAEGPESLTFGPSQTLEELRAEFESEDFGTYEVHIGEVHGNDDALVVSVEQYEKLLRAYEALRAASPTLPDAVAGDGT